MVASSIVGKSSTLIEVQRYMDRSVDVLDDISDELDRPALNSVRQYFVIVT